MTDKELLADWSLRSMAMVHTRHQEYVSTHRVRYIMETYIWPFLIVSIGGWFVSLPLEWYLHVSPIVRILIIGAVGAGILTYQIHQNGPVPDIIADASLMACLTMSDEDFKRLAALSMNPVEFLKSLTPMEYTFYAGILAEIATVLQLHAARLVIDKRHEALLLDRHLEIIESLTQEKDHS